MHARGITMRIGTLALAVILGGAVDLAAQEPEAGRQRAALASIIDRFWAHELAESPFLASSHGRREADGLFPEEGPEVRQRRATAEFRFLSELRELDLSALSEDEQLDAALLGRELSDRIDGFRLGEHLMPIDQRSGPQIWMPVIAERMSLARTEDFQNYLERLAGIPAYIDGTIAILENGLERGFIPPRVTLDGVLAQFDEQLVDDPETSPFFAPLRRLPATVPEADREELRSAARTRIGLVLAALRKLRNYLEDQYLPICRETIGAIEFPEGEAYYDHQVRRHTTTHLSPAEIHQIGIAEVARIRAAMEARIRDIGFEGDFAAFVEHLRTDPRYVHGSAEELLRGYRDVCKRIDAELPRFFGRLPRAPYGVREIPAFEAPRSTTAYYMPAPPDGRQPGWFYANTHDLRARPKYEMVALALHEAVPGHHLQIALANEIEVRPEFRKTLHFTAFVEGWALYAESLGTEMGLYADPVDDFGRLSYEMWRALRLVVDTGIHQLGWSREQAVALMVENSALTRANIEAEVDRYIAWPGQALAYKVGELRIRELRRRAEAALGARFDIRAFHDHLLAAGALPLDVLEARMDRFVESARKAGAGGGE